MVKKACSEYRPVNNGNGECGICFLPEEDHQADPVAAPTPPPVEVVETINIVNKRVDGYDAEFWNGSYKLLRDAIVEHLSDCIQDDDVAEEAILIEAIKTAAKRLVAPVSEAGEVPKYVSWQCQACSHDNVNEGDVCGNCGAAASYAHEGRSRR